MSSQVFFIDFRANMQNNFMSKLTGLLEKGGLSEVVRARDLVAVKLHFGEMGNAAFIRPIYLRTVVAAIKKAGGVPAIKLKRNPDILEWAGKNADNKIIMGFALEDKIDIKTGQIKKDKKKCDIVVINSIKDVGADRKTFVILSDTGNKEYKNIKLEKLADIIFDECLKLISR